MRGLRSHRPSPEGDGSGRGRSGAARRAGRPDTPAFGDPEEPPGTGRGSVFAAYPKRGGDEGEGPTHGAWRLSGRTDRAGRLFAVGGSTVAGLAGLATIGLLAGGCSAGGTGMRDEGPAVPAPVERTMPTPSQTPAPQRANVDPVSLLRADPQVSSRVKNSLKPCGSDSYPVNTSYGDLTGGSRPDIVINVTTCKDSIGIGTYVYRATGSGTAAPQSATPSSHASGASTGADLAAPTLDAAPGTDAGPTVPGSLASTYRTGTGAEPEAKPLPGQYENVFTSEEPSVYGTIDRGELVVTQQVYTKGDSVAYPSGEDVVTYDWARTKFTERYRVRNTYSKSNGDDDLGAPAPTVTASD
ncbi:hypothetical protein [Streptomyces sp. DW26H14]|uniref:hypothetical protein n=1 Tax=Streptomyces sp. DW26H14 TaxID=3435395 RepID=UPI00403D7FC6